MSNNQDHEFYPAYIYDHYRKLYPQIDDIGKFLVD